MSANSSAKFTAKSFKKIVMDYLVSPLIGRQVPAGIVINSYGVPCSVPFIDEQGESAIFMYKPNVVTGQPVVSKVSIAPVNSISDLTVAQIHIMPVPADVEPVVNDDPDAIENPVAMDTSADAKPVAHYVAPVAATDSDELTIRIEPKKRAAAPVAAAHTVDEQLVALVAIGNFLNGAGRNKAATELIAAGFAFVKGSRIMATDAGKQRAEQLTAPTAPVNVPVVEAVAA